MKKILSMVLAVMVAAGSVTAYSESIIEDNSGASTLLQDQTEADNNEEPESVGTLVTVENPENTMISTSNESWYVLGYQKGAIYGDETIAFDIDYSKPAKLSATFTVVEEDREIFNGQCAGALTLIVSADDIYEGSELWDKYSWPMQMWWGINDDELGLNEAAEEGQDIVSEKIGDYTYKITSNLFDNPLANGDLQDIDRMMFCVQSWGYNRARIKILGLDVMDESSKVLMSYDSNGKCTVTTASDDNTDYKAGDSFIEGELKYTMLEDGTLEVSSCDWYITVADIPSSINGMKVTSIGRNAFSSCISLTSVTIPDGVTSIGDDAFYYCTSLTSATIPDSVASIGDYAFAGCESLTSVTLPDSVTSIGDYAFWGCTSLTSATIPDSVTNIGNEAFFGCTSLTSVTIPDSVTDIGRVAFADCTSLTSVTIPGSVTSMGESAFYGCTSLTSVIISDGVTSMGESAFWGCTSLTSLTIPNSVTRIDNDAFSGCTSLTSVTIPDSVKSIGYGTFKDCTSLTSVTIPDSVTSIGNYAFSGCTSLTAINVGKENKNYCSENGVLFNKDKTTLITYPAGKTDNSYAIPDSVTDIGWGAFEGCTSLTSVTILDGVTSIDGFAFSGCTSLTSVKIPDSVTSIGYNVFYGCTSLTAINVGKENKNYCSENGVLFNKDKTTLITYPAGKTDNFYVIPEGVTSIGEDAFRGCASLTSVIIPDSVTNIDWYTFYSCTSLTSVTFPDSVESIGDYAFSGCVCLKDIYYSGTAEEWSEIYIAFLFNVPLSTVTIHYNSIGPDSVQIDIAKPESGNAPDTSGMKVEIAGGEKPQTITISMDGKLDLSGIADGKYSFTFSANNCAPRKYSVTVLNGTASGIDSSVELHLYGDINGDGKVNMMDVGKANAHAKNTSKLSGYDLSVSDINGDGKINMQDVGLMNAHAKNTKSLW